MFVVTLCAKINSFRAFFWFLFLGKMSQKRSFFLGCITYSSLYLQACIFWRDGRGFWRGALPDWKCHKSGNRGDGEQAGEERKENGSRLWHGRRPWRRQARVEWKQLWHYYMLTRQKRSCQLHSLFLRVQTCNKMEEQNRKSSTANFMLSYGENYDL